MGSRIFFGGAVVAAVIAGTVALFAPCCISVMLPAYLASSFQNRKVLLAMTFVFAAGVATIMLPIALGAQFASRIFTAQHTTVFTIGAVLMVALGIYTLLGGRMSLPMPGRRSGKGAGPVAIYSLGLFSGIASSCCAPVLAGVITLSGAVSSFGLALALGTAYVFGMVVPLFAIALAWDWRDWRSSRLFHPRSFTWQVGSIRRTIGGAALASGTLLLLMGALTSWIALRGPSMPASGGISAEISSHLQHYGHVAASALAWLPDWASLPLLAIGIALLARKAVHQRREPQSTISEQSSTMKEEPVEHEEQ